MADEQDRAERPVTVEGEEAEAERDPAPDVYGTPPAPEEAAMHIEDA